jgi:D-alanine-D-alanine ligase
VAPDGNYDYQHKYFTDDTQYFCPSGLPADLEKDIQAAVVRCAKVLGCRGWGRADLILRADGSFTLLEINTAPGMTNHSLVPMSAQVAGWSFEALCLEILAGARLG